MSYETPLGFIYSDNGKVLMKAPANISFCKIPNDVEQIDDYAFAYNKNLTEVVIPGNVKRIGPNAFTHCESLAKVSIEDGVAEIGEGAFAECKQLKSLYIPASVNFIGFGIAYKCSPELKLYCEVFKPHKKWTSRWNKLFARLENWEASTTYGVPREWWDRFEN